MTFPAAALAGARTAQDVRDFMDLDEDAPLHAELARRYGFARPEPETGAKVA